MAGFWVSSRSALHGNESNDTQYQHSGCPVYKVGAGASRARLQPTAEAHHHHGPGRPPPPHCLLREHNRTLYNLPAIKMEFISTQKV